MLFNTPQFFVFLAVVLILFYTAPRSWRKYILLAASYFFYMSFIPKFILLLLSLTAIDYTAARWICADRIAALTQSRAGDQPDGQSRPARLLQVLQFLRREHRAPAPPAGERLRAQHHSSLGDQFSHLPEHVVCDRRVPQGTGTDHQSQSTTRCSFRSSRNWWRGRSSARANSSATSTIGSARPPMTSCAVCCCYFLAWPRKW